LIKPLLEALRELPIGQAPKIELTKRIRAHGEILIIGSAVPRYVQDPHGDADIGDKADRRSQLQIAARQELPPKSAPEIFVSYTRELKPRQRERF
jgi:hypothetical protein